MKSLCFVSMLLLVMVGCKKDGPIENIPEIVKENVDWYILTAPDPRDVKAVYGDIDSTLVITTGYGIYTTSDKGKTWRDAGYKSNSGLFAFAAKGDTLLALNVMSKSTATGEDLFAKNPYYFSLDMGSTWMPYPEWPRDENLNVLLNRVKSVGGIEYSINRENSDGSIDLTRIRTSSGNLITLPAKHQIASLFFDQKSRLYISASAPICSSGSSFYCGSANGTIYISKKPQP